MQRTMPRALLSVLTLLVAAAAAAGEMWVPSADGRVVERADVIAVAHVKPGTIEYVPHAAANPAHGRSWEHHVTIVVTRTMKGTLAAGEHRVIVHYGLTPCVGGHWSEKGDEVNLPDRSEGVVEIVGNVFRGGWVDAPDDVREDHVWLLRRARAGGPGAEGAEGAEMLGIMDIQDVQPLARSEYLQIYLQDDPEPSLRAYVQKHPADAVRVLPYFHHRAVQRAIADPDPARRVERLLPYFSSYVLYGWRDEAGEAIEAAGDVAVPYLIALLADSGLDESRRTEVILKLGRIGSKRAVPALVALIEENDAILAGVAKAGKADAETLRRPGVSKRLHDVASAIYSLARIDEASAVPLIRTVEATWKGVLPAGHALLENCRDALERSDRDRSH